MQGLSKESAGRYHKTPRLLPHRIDNLSTALKFMERLGAGVLGTSAEGASVGD